MIGFLTILGYSLYDTVVVFDKVRENTAEAFRTKRMTYSAAANLAVNQTLVRSINTTVVALLPIAAVLFVGFTLLGPGTLLDLSLALFIGIAVGAYSSIFIATPLLVDLRRNEPAVRRARRVRRAPRRQAGPRGCPRRPRPAVVGADSTGAADAASAVDIGRGRGDAASACTSTPRPGRATSPSAPRSRSADAARAAVRRRGRPSTARSNHHQETA